MVDKKKYILVIAGKEFKSNKLIKDNVRRAEAFINQKFDTMKKESQQDDDKKNLNIETDMVRLLLEIVSEYLDEKDKVRELKKDMIIKVDSLINRAELLL